MTYGIVIAVLVLALLATLIAVIVQTNDDAAGSEEQDVRGAPPDVGESLPVQETLTTTGIPMASNDITMAELATSERDLSQTQISTGLSQHVHEVDHADEFPGPSEETDRDPGAVRI